MSSSPWQTMRNPSEDRLPGVRGVFAVLLEEPIVIGPRHFVHLSWQGEYYVIRDFLHDVERKQGDDLPLDVLWRACKVRIPCKGRLRRSVEDHAFWKEELRKLTEDNSAATSRTAPRPLGLAKGMGEIHSSFLDPLPENLLAAFDGEDS